ncbi:MAG: flagellar biosynthesis regulator FlaF [Bombella sp.]|nr:flagellar biosynthesis regulator FlaF [Bombella sp.]
MYQNNAMNAYRMAASSSLSDREADAECFRRLIAMLESVAHETDVITRNQVIAKNQRLWSLIQRANAVEAGMVETEDRLLFARMADQAQKYGIRAMLDPTLSLAPLMETARNVLDGLEMAIQEG